MIREKHINKNNLTILTMIETIKVSSRGQVVIPDTMRKELNIKEGSKLVIMDEGKRLIIELEQDFIKKLKRLEQDKENQGWLALAEKNLSEIWDNKLDDKNWERYL
jgi:AbrB family looped-hinge helix DNA binding protein